MLRLIEQSHHEIVGEHALLRARVATIVKALAQASFAPSALQEQRGDLDDLRHRLHTLRRRLNQLRRRRKSLLLRGRSVDTGPLAGPMMERLQAAEPGLEQSLLALQLLEQAYVQVTSHGDDTVTWRSKGQGKGDALGTGAASMVLDLLAGAPEETASFQRWLASNKRTST
jgi:uncharacterized NAD(P)/FAD-binding protein YdhS